MTKPDLTELIVPEDEALPRLMPRLMGRAFHVSKAEYFDAIMESGAIKPNTGELGSSFGAGHPSFFRNRGCVSIFDYRDPPPDKFELFRGKCPPTQPLSPDSPIVIFYLGESATGRLLPWRDWKTERRGTEDVVPYLEAGHPGAIPLSDVEEALRVSAVANPNGLVTILRRGRANAR